MLVPTTNFIYSIYIFFQKFLEISLICIWFAATGIAFTFCVCFKPKHLSKNNEPLFFRSWNLLLILQANVYPLSMPQCLFLKYHLHFYLQFSEISIYLPTILMMHFYLKIKKENYILTLLFSVNKIAQFIIPIRCYFKSYRYSCMLQSDF